MNSDITRFSAAELAHALDSGELSSVEDPMANSSMLVLPRIGMPADFSRLTSVAS